MYNRCIISGGEKTKRDHLGSILILIHFQMGAPDSVINVFAINIIPVQFLYTFQKPS